MHVPVTRASSASRSRTGYGSTYISLHPWHPPFKAVKNSQQRRMDNPSRRNL